MSLLVAAISHIRPVELRSFCSCDALVEITLRGSTTLLHWNRNLGEFCCDLPKEENMTVSDRKLKEL